MQVNVPINQPCLLLIYGADVGFAKHLCIIEGH